jgi:predicted O-methyltransferase YrrM
LPQDSGIFGVMFHSIPPSVLARMKYLEQIDANDRRDGTPRLRRLRQIPPETGKFLALLAAAAPEGEYLEIGTSAGYSTLWLGLACQTLGRAVTTFEVLPEKAKLARETFQIAGLEGTVKLVEDDARKFLSRYDRIAFWSFATPSPLAYIVASATCALASSCAASFRKCLSAVW